mmetsp:Transcript_420/g.1084  ORF Transcript_420/g.1084 Transcript_420/m.1084 type:complete len:116 (-) Transcript_420:304-651(-)
MPLKMCYTKFNNNVFIAVNNVLIAVNKSLISVASSSVGINSSLRRVLGRRLPGLLLDRRLHFRPSWHGTVRSILHNVQDLRFQLQRSHQSNGQQQDLLYSVLIEQIVVKDSMRVP